MREPLTIAVTVAVAVIAVTLAGVAVTRRRRSDVHLTVAAFAVAAATHTAVNVFSLFATTRTTMTAAWIAVWIVSLAIGPLFVLLVATYVGVPRHRIRLAAWPAVAGFVVLAILVATNPIHHRAATGFTDVSDRIGYFVQPAALHWLNLVLQAFVLPFSIVGLHLWMRAYMRAPRLYRGTLRLIAGAAILPVALTGVPLALGWFDLGNVLTGVGLVVSILLVMECLRRLPSATAGRSIVQATRERVVELMHEGVLVVDRHGAVVDANPAAARLLGVDRVLGTTAAASLPDWLNAIIARTAPGTEAESLHHEVGGRVLDVTVTAIDHDPEAGGDRIVVLRDGTARVRAERRLEILAHTDSVTGLPNRVQLDLEMRPRLAAGERLALLLLDLDGFKAVNDTYGHGAGDDLLREIGQRLRRTLDASWFVARLGGDEFVVLAPYRDADEVPAIADEVVEVFTSSDLSAGMHRVKIFASVGIAIAPLHATDAPSLMRCADVAMYRAKRLGSRSALYSPEDDVNSPDRLQMIFDLRRAIARDELVLHYQPVVNLLTGHGVGCEALVRWDHPTRGLLFPGDFLDLVDEAGLGRDFSRWVAATALAARRSWPVSDAGFQVAFNLSVADLADGVFIDDLLAIIRDSGLPPAEIVVEVTETALLSHVGRSEEHDSIDRLLAYGCRLVLDDFGTGYASITTLRDIRGSVAKIAGTFVTAMKDNPGDRALVHGLVDLARSLDYRALAEWVEDAETLDLVRHAGCRFGQGFFLARPMPSDDLAEWIRTDAARRDADPSMP